MERQDFRKFRHGWSKRLGNRIFPERQVFLRTAGRVSFVRISPLFQVFVVALIAVTVGWMAFTSVDYFLHGRILAAKDNQIANARLAYHSLLAEVAEYQKKFTIAVRDLEENHSLMLSLVEQNTTLQQNLQTVENQLQTTRADRQMVASARHNLKIQLNSIEDKMRSLASHNFLLRGDLDNVETGLESALAERNMALFEGNRMRRKINELQIRLSNLQTTQIEAVQRLSGRAASEIEAIERVVGIAGIKTAQLLGTGNGLPKGQGGPFIAVQRDDSPANRLKADLANLHLRLDHWGKLEDMVRRLPLSSPLKYYSITSRFGKRRDPFNKKWASHYGVDMGAVFRSSVYATAPGEVTYVGWKGKYGRLIEIDHGAGIKTRYAHLHKTLVKKGQVIGYREKIALVGSTGRSTGAHLHYEVVFKGKPRNPMKFIKAGLHVLQE